MSVVFIDTAYLVALLVPDDELHAAAAVRSRQLSESEKLTSDFVLIELLAFVSRRGPEPRAAAAALIDQLRSDPLMTVVRSAPDLFDTGFDLYRTRPDKSYSLTDCTSMVICQERGVRQVLTHDRHFTQEGFEILL